MLLDLDLDLDLECPKPVWYNQFYDYDERRYSSVKTLSQRHKSVAGACCARSYYPVKCFFFDNITNFLPI